MDDSIIAFGGEAVKFLDEEKTKVGGFLCRFTTADDPDIPGDYFTKSTDFGVDPDGARLPLYYQHGFDPVLKNTKIGSGTVSVKDAGLWFESQLTLSDEYREYVVRLIEEGRLGYSSGAAAHLVGRKAISATTHEILSWPLAETSLTPEPAEPRNVVSMKALAAALKGVQVSDSGEPEAIAEDVTVAIAEDTESEVTEPELQTETKMENEIKTDAPVETPAVDVDALVEAKVAEAMASIKSAPPVKAPTIVKADEIGVTEKKAFDRWVRTGDVGAVKHLVVGETKYGPSIEVKASNATDMNITTAADGGNTVQQGIFPGIIARRDEMMLANKLGVRRFQGTGTTFDVPTDNEADGEFITKAEATAFDQDSPAIGQTVLTLVKYTKYLDISDELLEDSTANILEFLNDFIARGMAKTHNSLMVAESVANGSELKATASTTAIVLGELEDAVYNNDLADYLDDAGSVGFVMKPATFAEFITLGGTSNRYYAPTAQGQITPGRSLLEMPVHFSQKVDAYGTANNRFVHFANWNAYMGLYEAPSLRFVRDPFTVAINGQTRLLWNFRCDYGVLQAEAGGFIRHITT